MTQKLPYLIAIILICIAPMADTYVLIPAMSDIGKAFPQASLTKLNLILTISSLFVIPASLVAGKLVESGKITKKNCLLLGMALFSLGGAAGALVVNINYLLFTRAILGIGNGLATAMVVTLTADFFTEEEGATVMGLYTAIGGLIAIAMTIVSGYLVLVDWRLSFTVYLSCLLVVLYHAVVLKKTKTDQSSQDSEKSASGFESAEPAGPRPPLGTAVWVLILITIFSQTLGNSLYLALSRFIEGEGLGDAAATGVANGVLTVAYVLSALLFGKIYSKIGRHSAFLFFILMAAGFFLLAHAPSYGFALAALIVWGVGYGLSIPYVMQQAIVCPPKELITFTGSLINSCIFFSFVLSTFVEPFLAALTGDESIRKHFAGIGAILAACAVLSPALVNKMKKSPASDLPQS